LKRGYIRAPSNDITSIPDIHVNPFSNHHVHLVTGLFQQKEGTDPSDYVALHYMHGFVITTYLGDDHSFFFLDGQTIDAFPLDKANLMVQFPYNTTGCHMERCLNGDGSLRLLNNRIFSPPNSDYALPGASSIGAKDIIRGDKAYSRKFDSRNVTRVELTDLRDKPEVYITDGTIVFFGRWLLRNLTTYLEEDIAIIPLSLADLLRQLFQLHLGSRFGYLTRAC
jgi:hypothetical protein